MREFWGAGPEEDEGLNERVEGLKFGFRGKAAPAPAGAL